MDRIPLATWNEEQDFWEGGQPDIFGLSVAYAETFPASGMTRSGQLFALPTWVPPTTGPASSSSPTLPTPQASDYKRDNNPGRGDRHSPELTAVSEHFPTA